jgi:hypothetical protein
MKGREKEINFEGIGKSEEKSNEVNQNYGTCVQIESPSKEYMSLKGIG